MGNLKDSVDGRDGGVLREERFLLGIQFYLEPSMKLHMKPCFYPCLRGALSTSRGNSKIHETLSSCQSFGKRKISQMRIQKNLVALFQKGSCPNFLICGCTLFISARAQVSSPLTSW